MLNRYFIRWCTHQFIKCDYYPEGLEFPFKIWFDGVSNPEAPDTEMWHFYAAVIDTERDFYIIDFLKENLIVYHVTDLILHPWGWIPPNRYSNFDPLKTRLDYQKRILEFFH